MHLKKLKFLILALVLLSLLFFSNDFGLIDIEKEAIITAIAVDYDDTNAYQVTAQIAVPEASNTTTENTKAQITGKGTTIGSAIKNTGDISGWFPQLAFCNLIIIGSQVANDNIINVLDYFAKTLRLQDSAQLILANGDAKDLLKKTTPLDNISSFAIQKILFKNPGFDTDVATNDIKSFCAGYYSPAKSSFMPIIKLLTEENSPEQNGKTNQESQGSSKENGQGEKGKNFFDASTTALFYNGVKVGELDKDLTHIYNILWRKVKGTTIPISYPQNNGMENYLLKVLRCTPKIKTTANIEKIVVEVNVNLYCKILDHNSADHDASLYNNKPLPYKLVQTGEELLKSHVLELFEVSRQTNCDFMNINDKLYRFCHKYYHIHKDNFLSRVVPKVKVTITGQK